MASQQHTPRKKIKLYPYVIVLAFIWSIALIAFIFAALTFQWDWTGIAGGVSNVTTTHTSHGTTITTEFVPAKTLWDWLQLFTALGGVLLTIYGSAMTVAAQIQANRQQAVEDRQLTTLHTYMDQISQLFLDGKLDVSKPDNNFQKIAQVKTLAILRELDTSQKSLLLKFLYELGLIEVRSYLSKSPAKVNISNADLSNADLHGIDLSNADLSCVNLSDANLTGANLHGTNLSEADLTNATVTQEQLAKTASLKSAIMPDGSIHP